MSKHALPFIVAAGAAAFFLTSQKKGKSKKAKGNGVGPAPSPEPTLEPTAVEQMLSDLGYPPGAIDGAFDKDTVLAIDAFQSDWNSLMEWMWEHNPNVHSTDPKFGKIAVTRDWDFATEERAIRAMDQFQDPKGSFITINGEHIPVENFRDMVVQAYAHTS